MKLSVNKVIIGVLIFFNLLTLFQLKQSRIKMQLKEHSNLDISNELIENYTVQLRIEGLQIKKEIDLILKEDTTKFQTLVEKHPRVVFWIPKEHCSDCIIEEITYFNNFFEDYGDDVVIFITSESNKAIFNVGKRLIYFTSEDSPVSKWKKDVPVVFYIDSSLQLKNTFIIEPLTPLLTTQYYETIKQKYLLIN